MKTKKEKLFLLALHTADEDQVMFQAERAIRAGVHGILLVNNGGLMKFDQLLRCSKTLKTYYQNHYIGVNILDVPDPTKAIALVTGTYKDHADILWVDNGGISEEPGYPVFTFPAEDIFSYLSEESAPKFFGGIAFKYQPPVQDLSAVAALAGKYFSAVITSGEKTGMPPSLEKIQTIRNAVSNDTMIGIASGMDINNIDTYMPFANVFIVGTSLQKSTHNPYEYSEEKIRDMALKF